MLKQSAVLGASFIFIYLSFVTWEKLIQYSVVALVVLFPLATILYVASYRLRHNVTKAQFSMILKPETGVSKLFNGVISSHIYAFIFTVCSLPVLTWYYVTASSEQFGLFGGTVFVAGLSYVWLQKSADDIFKKPFSEHYLVNYASVFASIICFFPLWYFAWALDLNSGILLGEDLNKAVLNSLDEAPDNLGALSPLFSFPYVVDAFKIWSVAQLREFANLAFIISIESALVGFVISRTAILVIHFTKQEIFHTAGS